ncbi:MAG: glycine--tRNA ligase subunit beta [Woeseiaceae bacterium]
MSKARHFLVEIGTEELPPKALRSLMDAFAAGLKEGIDTARLDHGDIKRYASPRRLAVLIESLASGQEDRVTQQKGPPVSIAFNDDGELTAAGEAFAKKCGVAPDKLGRTKTEKGEWVSCELVEQGLTAAELMPKLIEDVLAALPIPRRMRWGAGEAEFVRPVHWIVMIHGATVVKANILGVPSGKKTRGHRFMGESSITINKASDYLSTLEKQGSVIADFDRRRQLVEQGVVAEAKAAGGAVVDGESLYDEVTALVEWPVPMTGGFDEKFLQLPREVVVSTLTGHQRYFPVADENGELLPSFITVANIDSKDPAQVRSGNERVILPRLADAAFFWDGDRRTPLGARANALLEVVYQRGLGSLADKSVRIASLAGWVGGALKIDPSNSVRAAELAKCDLITDMVGEFPDLQGTMGGYYAALDGENAEVATAISEQYHPRFAGDSLPSSVAGQLLALADRADTLAGVFAIGKKPTGNRDPFGLRRAALGVVRLLVECKLDLGLKELIAEAVNVQPAGNFDSTEVQNELYIYISERLRRYFLDRDVELDTETFDAVLARQPSSLVDFERRLDAVQRFTGHEAASSLAAANKRIANILKQAEDTPESGVKEKLLEDGAETALWTALASARETVAPKLAEREYTAALDELATLREVVDKFFDDVMVMADDTAVRNNRLALLSELRALFLGVADISKLAIS